jgi:hypothetical protein
MRVVEYKVTAGAEAAATTSVHAMWREVLDGKGRGRKEGRDKGGEGTGDDVARALFLSRQHATHT